MTQEALFKAIRDMGLSITIDDGEYRIAYRGRVADTESSAYYTGDRDDALATARCMVSW